MEGLLCSPQPCWPFCWRSFLFRAVWYSVESSLLGNFHVAVMEGALVSVPEHSCR